MVPDTNYGFSKKTKSSEKLSRVLKSSSVQVFFKFPQTQHKIFIAVSHLKCLYATLTQNTLRITHVFLQIANKSSHIHEAERHQEHLSHLPDHEESLVQRDGCKVED